MRHRSLKAQLLGEGLLDMLLLGDIGADPADRLDHARLVAQRKAAHIIGNGAISAVDRHLGLHGLAGAEHVPLVLVPLRDKIAKKLHVAAALKLLGGDAVEALHGAVGEQVAPREIFHKDDRRRVVEQAL